MRRLPRGSRLLLASHNQGKVRELSELIAPYGLQAVAAAELLLPQPKESGSTFIENARIKAVAAAVGAGLPALADDSGLEVALLGGAPGIYSARWAGPAGDFARAMGLLAEKVRARGGWTPSCPRANFTAALCLAWPDGESACFEGKVYGRLVWPPRGEKGFGYDAMFAADSHTMTFGEMEPDAKHAISHRARAFAELCRACLGERGRG